MAMGSITAENPPKKSRNLRMDLLIPTLWLTTLKNHRGRNSRNKMTLGLDDTARPKKMPATEKRRGVLVRWVACREAMQESERKISKVGVIMVPV
jgi:hypothetical protein